MDLKYYAARRVESDSLRAERERLQENRRFAEFVDDVDSAIRAACGDGWHRLTVDNFATEDGEAKVVSLCRAAYRLSDRQGAIAKIAGVCLVRVERYKAAEAAKVRARRAADAVKSLMGSPSN